jgi:ABC-2 type transport system ATP-binding protein
MSGLDPLGRREVRSLILRLRDRGTTVFFSSHVLSDAEALCNRVAILARGRLVASGRLDEMLAFRARGWELVVSGLPTAPPIGAAIRRVIRIGEDRFQLELPLDPPPERLLSELTAAGARLVSLNPIRDTLEDFFVEQVTAPDVLAARRGLEDDDRRVERTGTDR